MLPLLSCPVDLGTVYHDGRKISSAVSTKKIVGIRDVSEENDKLVQLEAS